MSQLSSTAKNQTQHPLATKLHKEFQTDNLDKYYGELARSSVALDRKFEPLLDTELRCEQLHQLLATYSLVPDTSTLKNWFKKPSVLMNTMIIQPTDDFDSIFDTLKSTSILLQNHIEVDVDFTQLRPSRSIIRSSTRQSLGPVRFMELFERAPQPTLNKEDLRFILNIDHHDILDFLSYAATAPKHVSFCLVLNDDFITALKSDKNYQLRHRFDTEETQSISAKSVFIQIENLLERKTRLSLLHGDRVQNIKSQHRIDESWTLNRNLTWAKPYELSTFANLDATFLYEIFKTDPEQLKTVFETTLNLLDNVFELNFYAIAQTQQTSQSQRRIAFNLARFTDILPQLYRADEPQQSWRELTQFLDTIELALFNQSFVQGKKRGFRHELHSKRHTVRTRHIPQLVWNDNISAELNGTSPHQIWPLLGTLYPGRVHRHYPKNGPKMSHVYDQLMSSYENGDWACELKEMI